MRLGIGWKLGVGAPFLDAAVPRTDVLADVTTVDLRTERRAVVVRDRAGGLRPVRQALGRVEHTRLVERVRWTGVDAERARAAVGVPRRVAAAAPARNSNERRTRPCAHRAPAPPDGTRPRAAPS